MANGLRPYDPNQRPGSGQSEDSRSGDQHFHYHDHRTFVHADSSDEEPEDEAPEPILARWQKNALGVIAIIGLFAIFAPFLQITRTVTTNTVTEYPASEAASSTEETAPKSVAKPAATDDTEVPTAAAAAAAAAGINTMAKETTADQMLEEWSRAVTGNRGTDGFLLVNGSGDPGENCNAHDGKHLLKFGATMGGEGGLPIPDYFGGTFLDVGASVGGAYWYNNQDNILITRRLEMKQIKGNGHKSLEDGAEEVEPLSPGVVLINGVRFHQCVL